ncbi:hypothetical protein [Sediminibacterium sp. TEGAF015]|uniref:hypothetical protein n=1 Tax=Sediminibacterium sp. TEGAF015 TaxID=575378 RepID=UPI00220A3737|nr:hypothetical protein [Sediminibacterium sp. TEGAF015]BDQ12890.1 hypothetical protein TEGAF0_21070 [Sediminibacterium sp. TEGAF015]
MKKVLVCLIGSIVFNLSPALSQNWSPEEQLELFGYCEKSFLMKELGISEETANKVGQINYWATLQKLKIEANTNDTFATVNEVNQEVLKKYKAISIIGDKAKSILNRTYASGCAITQLSPNSAYDTLSKAQLITGYKSKYRKKLIDQLGINGRQADMIIDAEARKQKESLLIAQIPVTDFNRIRKTVALNIEYARKIILADISETQKEQAIQFFIQNQL